MSSRSRIFQFCFFFLWRSERFPVYVCLSPNFDPCDSFSCYSSHQPFCYVLSVPTIYSTFFVSFTCDGSFVLLHSASIWGQIFQSFLLECLVLFVLIVRHTKSLKSPFFVNILIFISSNCIVRLAAILFRFCHPSISLCDFPFLPASLVALFTCLISHPGFVFLIRFLWGDRFYPRLVSPQHTLARFVQWCFPSECLETIC